MSRHKFYVRNETTDSPRTEETTHSATSAFALGSQVESSQAELPSQFLQGWSQGRQGLGLMREASFNLGKEPGS